MAKTKSRRTHKKRGFFKTLKNTSKKAIPVVASGLKKIGKNVKNITIKSTPTIEKGLGTIYNSVLTGFDLGVKGVKKGVSLVKKTTASGRKHKSRRGRR